jgi:hypothetical protein
MSQLVSPNDFVVDAFNNLIPALARHTVEAILPSGTSVVSLNVPAGYAWFLGVAIPLINPTSGAITVSAVLTRGGNNYAIRTSASIAANGGIATTAAFLALSGDDVTITTTAAGVVFSVHGILIPLTNHPHKIVSMVLASGNNTLYTCPEGRVAYVNSSTLNVAGLVGGTVVVGNSSGGARIYLAYVVPSAGVPDATNLRGRASVADTAVGNMQEISARLTAGATLVVNSDGAGNQMAWANLYEVPA